MKKILKAILIVVVFSAVFFVTATSTKAHAGVKYGTCTYPAGYYEKGEKYAIEGTVKATSGFTLKTVEYKVEDTEGNIVQRAKVKVNAATFNLVGSKIAKKIKVNKLPIGDYKFTLTVVELTKKGKDRFPTPITTDIHIVDKIKKATRDEWCMKDLSYDDDHEYGQTPVTYESFKCYHEFEPVLVAYGYVDRGFDYCLECAGSQFSFKVGSKTYWFGGCAMIDGILIHKGYETKNGVWKPFGSNYYVYSIAEFEKEAREFLHKYKK